MRSLQCPVSIEAHAINTKDQAHRTVITYVPHWRKQQLLCYNYVCDYYGSCCVLGLRHFACDISLKLNGILGQSHLYSL
jgi:hypothetical protein